VAVGVLGDGDDVGDRFPPRQFVGMVLVRSDEHHREFPGRDAIGQAVLLIQSRRYPDAEHSHEMVNGPGGSRSAKQHGMLFCGADTPGNDLAGFFPEPGRLQAGARRFRMGVGVQRQHCIAEVILYERQRAPRSRVVGVGDPARSEWPVDDLVFTDYGCSNEIDQSVGHCDDAIGQPAAWILRRGGVSPERPPPRTWR